MHPNCDIDTSPRVNERRYPFLGGRRNENSWAPAKSSSVITRYSSLSQSQVLHILFLLFFFLSIKWLLLTNAPYAYHSMRRENFGFLVYCSILCLCMRRWKQLTGKVRLERAARKFFKQVSQCAPFTVTAVCMWFPFLYAYHLQTYVCPNQYSYIRNVHSAIQHSTNFIWALPIVITNIAYCGEMVSPRNSDDVSYI